MDLKGVKFTKSLGQNFLTDKNLLSAIVSDAGIQNDDIVLEIGAGAGTLTYSLAKAARIVVAYEIDRSLKERLEQNLSDVTNVRLNFGDFMEAAEEDIYNALGSRNFKVVANLPYYITTPILFKLLNMNSPPQSITVTVQKEVAQRLVAKHNSPDYGALTVTAAADRIISIKRIIKKEMFVPRPKVDSAVVRLDLTASRGIKDIALYRRIARVAFSMRRKTLVNNLSAGFSMDKDKAVKILEAAGIDTALRGEAVDIDGFIRLSNIMSECGV